MTASRYGDLPIDIFGFIWSVVYFKFDVGSGSHRVQVVAFLQTFTAIGQMRAHGGPSGLDVLLLTRVRGMIIVPR
jgi:hypothetical protein